MPPAGELGARLGSPATAYQRKDSYYRRAKREGYRSRAAYKLLEIDRRERLLRPGLRVVDLGCWPGGWLEVAARRVGPKGRVVGVDLKPTEPLAGFANTIALVGDFTQPPFIEEILRNLGGRAELLLCDAAPALSGVRERDRAREEELLVAVERAIPQLLCPGGALVLKLLDCPEAQAVAKRIRTLFESAAVRRLAATRAGSSERYLIGRRYRDGPAR